MRVLAYLILLINILFGAFQAQAGISIQGSGNVLTRGDSNTITSKVNITEKPTTQSGDYNSASAAKDLEEGRHRKVIFTDKVKELSVGKVSAQGKLTEVSNRKKVLILTATNYETEILHQEAEKLGLKVIKQIVNDQVVYTMGTLGGVDILHMQPGMMGMMEPGNTPLMLMSVFKEIKPTYIISTGIAFGRQGKEQVLGDVLVSRQLANYESKKETNEDIYFRGDKVTSPMLNRINSGIRTWKGVKIHQGLVLSGNVLVNSKEFLNYVSQREPEYVGGDMESYGVYAVASMMGAQWIMIKGISDWADGTKNDAYHKIALQNACQFILHVIKEGNLR